ncbi:hypothetical protein IL306_012987 [Fusarium sp. DS 682]|nr:hypothetical protein IL306_012987 [Fusarium sp. DS 682]
MFVYEGRLEWGRYGQNETALIILPAGPIRVGDVVWFLSQWTVDSQGNKKPNLRQRIPVHKVTKTADGDDTFTAKPGYYSWEMTSRQGYEKLEVVMSKTDGTPSPMDFKRIWTAKGEVSTDSGKIWFGKINWPMYATDEMGIFIAPEGLGEGKPILSMWQWTHDDTGTEKSPSFRAERQKMLSDESGKVKFSYHSYYDITCTLEKDDTLSVHMKGPEADQELGQFKQLTVINPHSHDWNPPDLTPPQNAEVQVRLPQPESSLPRVLEPLAFPNGLIETLRHTIAFADQAGYLAKYAHEKFNQLDADYHVQAEEIQVANAEIAELKKDAKKLADDLTVEKAKTTDLTKRLSEQQAAFEEELKKRDEDLKKDKQHDTEDHKTIDRLLAQLEYERASKAEVQKKLDEKSTALAEAEARLLVENAKVATLTGRIAAVEAELEVEKKDVEKLQKEIKEKTDRISQLEKTNSDLQSKLNQALSDLKSAQNLVNDRDATIRRQTDQINSLQKESQAKTLTVNKLQEEVKSLQQQLNDLLSKPQFRFKCNIRNEVTSNKDIMVDLTGGGGYPTPVQSIANGNYKTNPNLIWDIYSIPTRNNRVVIKNSRNSYVLWSKGESQMFSESESWLTVTGQGQKVQCDTSCDASDPAAQWDLQGVTLDSIDSNTTFK